MDANACTHNGSGKLTRPFAALGRILEEFNRGFACRLRLSLPWSVHRDMPPTTAAGGASGSTRLRFQPKSQRWNVWSFEVLGLRARAGGAPHLRARAGGAPHPRPAPPTAGGSKWVGRSGGPSRDGRRRRQPGGSVGRASRPKICFAALRAAGRSIGGTESETLATNFVSRSLRTQILLSTSRRQTV